MRKELKMQKWGNSFAIRIPKTMVDKLEISRDDSLEIRDIKSSIVIKKIKNTTNKFMDEKDLISSMPHDVDYYKEIAINDFIMGKEYE